MALQSIRKHAGDAKEQVYLHPTDAESQLQSQLQSQRHFCPEHHKPQPVSLPELNITKSLIGRPDLRIYKHIFPVLNYLLSMHLPRIAWTIQILIQICCLMKEQPVVSTLSAVS